MTDDFPGTPYREGEQIPDLRIRDLFQRPPSIPESFGRSGLIIGSQGAGKTALFRFHKVRHDDLGGIGLHINLLEAFSSIPRIDPIGPWASATPPELEQLLAGKASALLALMIAKRLLVKRKVTIPMSWLSPCLPRAITPVSESTDADELDSIQLQVARLPPAAFEGVFALRPLTSCVSRIGGYLTARRSPLLLLFDRADLVPPPTLFPVYDLLNQSFQYVALLATRPGHAGHAVARGGYGGVPGDHYDPWYLGIEPRSIAWTQFLQMALAAQFGARFDRLPVPVRNTIIHASRDCCRLAVELCHHCLTVPATAAEAHLADVLENRRDNLRTAARNALRVHGLDFLDLIRTIRKEAIQVGGLPRPPLVINVRQAVAENIWTARPRWERIVDDALRSGAFVMPEGERWVPGSRPDALELPVYIAWDREDGLAALVPGEALQLNYGEDALLGPAPRKPQAPVIFVAFRFQESDSAAFRAQLAHAIDAHPSLSGAIILDGKKIPSGANWADIIRSRIKSAALVIGDVTGLRNDVVFELGFAYGLRKPIIPVVSLDTHLKGLPSWLTSRQLARYGDDASLQMLVADVHNYITNPGLARVERPSQAVPSRSVWLSATDWDRQTVDQFETVSDQEGLGKAVLKGRDLGASQLAAAGSAAFLVAGLDGGKNDAAVHFLCGSIMARPRAGQGYSLSRRICLLGPNGPPTDFVADSLGRCADVVRLIDNNQVRSEVVAFAQEYKKWLRGGRGGRKK